MSIETQAGDEVVSLAAATVAELERAGWRLKVKRIRGGTEVEIVTLEARVLVWLDARFTFLDELGLAVEEVFRGRVPAQT